MAALPLHDNMIRLFVILFLLFNISNVFAEPFSGIVNSQPDSDLLILKRKHLRALSENNQVEAGDCLAEMGKICFNQGHYSMALDFYRKADRIYANINDRSRLAGNLSAMGTLYYYNKQENEAFQLYTRALKMYRSIRNSTGTAEVLGQIGHFYEKKHLYDSAFFYQQTALRLYKSVNLKDGAAKIYENLGSIYEDLEQYDSAQVCFNRSLALYKNSNNKIASIEVINNLGDIQRKTGNYAVGISLSKRAYGMALESKNLYQQASCTKDLGLAYRLLGRLDSAFHYMELSRKYSLEVYSAEAMKQTSFLQVLYEMDQKSDEIAKLESDRKINMLIGGASLLFLIVIFLSAVFVIGRQRVKIKEQNTLARQQEADHELISLELKNRQLEEESLKQQLQLKMRELSNHTLTQVRNNQVLEDLRSTLVAMIKEDKRDQKKQMQQLVSTINESFNNEAGWKEFNIIFEQVHQSFFDKLKDLQIELTAADIRLIALMKMNLNSSDIAVMLGISQDSLRVSRYRLRKKLNMTQGENLSAFVHSL